MSAILGINLLDKLYLISDTRETIEYPDRTEYKDDLIKAFVLSKNCSAVAAGKTTAASFLLNGVQLLLDAEATIDDVIHVFENEAANIVSDFVNTTMQHDKGIALIVCGFNADKGKDIKASTLGEAMSGTLVAAGEGSFQNQSVSPLIIQALISKIQAGNGLRGDAVVTVKTTNSKMFSIVIDIRTNNVDIKEVPCYEYVVFHPDQKKEKMKVPFESISYLDFRERKDPFSDDVIFDDVEHIMSLLNREIQRRGFQTVGGHIFSLLQTPVGAVFPTGDLATIKSGQIVPLGSFFVDPQNGMSYRFSDGSEGVYRHLRDVRDYERPNLSMA